MTRAAHALTKTGAFELAHGRDHGFNFIHAQDVASATERALTATGPFGLLAYKSTHGGFALVALPSRPAVALAVSDASTAMGSLLKIASRSDWQAGYES